MMTVKISEPGSPNIHICVETHATETSAGPGTGDVYIHLTDCPAEKSAEGATSSSLLELIGTFVTAIVGMLEVLEAAPAVIAVICAVLL